MIPVFCFERDFTAEEQDRGEGMTYHPCFCEPWSRILIDKNAYDPQGVLELSREYLYCPKTRRFLLPGCVWFGNTFLPKISADADVRKGDPYPSHWLCDPFTADPLPRK
jgi:hypothetical protein